VSDEARLLLGGIGLGALLVVLLELVGLYIWTETLEARRQREAERWGGVERPR
jgi:chloramphenicol 3-O-phosphotransferase